MAGSANRNRILPLGAAFAALAAAPALGDVTFTPSVGASAVWVDNIDLAADGAPKESAFALEITPGFTLSQQAGRLRSFLNYTADGFYFPSDTDRNALFHNAAAGADINLIDRWFTLNGSANYDQIVIDPAVASNSDLFLNTGNLTDTFSAQVTPRLNHRFNIATLDVSYLYGIVDNQSSDSVNAELEDSQTSAVQFLLESPDERAPLTWALRYRREETNYDIANDYAYADASVELGYRVGRNWRVFASAGKESNLALSLDAARLDESVWTAGVRWRSGQRSFFQANYGRRFYGSNYGVQFEREGRRMRLALNYSEQPTTEAQSRAGRPVTSDPFLTPQPGAPGFGRITSEVYLDRRGSARVTLLGRKTEVDLTAGSERRRYLSTGLSEKSEFAGVGVTRRISSRDQIGGGAQLRKYELRDGVRYDNLRLNLFWGRQLSPRMSLQAAVAHEDRDQITIGYKVTWFTLGLNRTF